MNFRTFDLNLLRVLDALLATGSTVGAGARLGLSQPAVSAALGRLRHALGDPLFVRRGSRLEPTDFARTLALPLHETLSGIETLLAGPGQFDAARSDAAFTLAGSDFFAELLMPALGDLLTRTAPGVRVQLVDLVPASYVGALDRAEVDLALIPQGDFPDWVDALPVFRSGFVVVARRHNAALAAAAIAPGKVIPVDLFCDMGHVVFSPQGRLQAMGDAALAAMGRRRRVAMTVPVFAGVAAAVASSDMIGLMPEQLARRVAPRLGLGIWAAPMALPVATMCMAWHRRASATPASLVARHGGGGAGAA